MRLKKRHTHDELIAAQKELAKAAKARQRATMVNDGLNNNNANRKRTTREFLETVPKIIGEHEQWIVNTNQMIGKGSYGAIFICTSKAAVV